MTSTPRRFFIAAALALTLFVAPVSAGQREDARAGVARALAALERDDPRTARVELMNAIKADPASQEARIVQARVLLMLGNGRGAQDELDRAKQLGAPLGPMRHLLAHAALMNGDPEQAIKEASAADADEKELLFCTRIEAQAYQAWAAMPTPPAPLTARVLSIARIALYGRTSPGIMSLLVIWPLRSRRPTRHWRLHQPALMR